MSYIFQDATLLPWRTVEQNVGLGLELEGAARPTREQKTAALLELVGPRTRGEAYPRQLSGGMKMRVSIARALATNPRLLLMDEPFAALDEMTRDRLNEEMLRLRAEQKWTAVFVTHSVAEAVFLSTRIVVLAPHPGRIHAEFAVDLPGPRTAATRESPEFDALAVKCRTHCALRSRRGRVGGYAMNRTPDGGSSMSPMRPLFLRRCLCCGSSCSGSSACRRTCCRRRWRWRSAFVDRFRRF